MKGRAIGKRIRTRTKHKPRRKDLKMARWKAQLDERRAEERRG